MKLTDLSTSISDMSDEDLRKAILAVRKDRRVSKAPVIKAKKSQKASANKADKLREMIANMSPEEKAALLAKMSG